MIFIFLIPMLGLITAYFINKLFSKAQFRGADVLPFFFIPTSNLITDHLGKPSFLPYGFLFFFILVIVITVKTAIQEKNISLGKTFRKLWQYLSICSVLWYCGLLVMLV